MSIELYVPQKERLVWHDLKYNLFNNYIQTDFYYTRQICKSSLKGVPFEHHLLMGGDQVWD